MREKISVIIPTFNCEETLKRAIQSVLWADEIFVVDSFSTDKTVEVAESLGARVEQHKYGYSAKQKNWAIPRAKYNWILLLDSDEEVTNDLRDTILEMLENKEDMDTFDGYGVARRHWFLGKFLRWGGRYPLYNIRLFKKSCRYEDRFVHAHILLPKEKMMNIPGDILHYSDRNLTQFFEKFNRYTTWQAQYMLKIHKSGIMKVSWKEFFINPIYTKAVMKDVWQFLPMTPMLRFVYMYILRFGFLDGKYGFLIAVLYAFQDYVSKTKFLEMSRKKPTARLFVQQAIVRVLSRTHIGKRDTSFLRVFRTGSEVNVPMRK